MPSQFCLTFRMLDLRFHGRGDGGAPEWPPSPLRAFQALVCAAMRLRPDALDADSAAARAANRRSWWAWGRG